MTFDYRRGDPLPPWSDGCSGFPDGPWQDCCVAHDWAYREIRRNRACGAWSGWRCALERRKADFALGACVANRGYRVIGLLMALGVRACGWLPLYFSRKGVE